ncbi:chorismate-binding protein, partial [Salmonella enterica]|uniref:chorismate-binding protein n=1 Tax=Salmonella enterica TaxID=28901 RepID=UPI003298DD02
FMAFSGDTAFLGPPRERRWGRRETAPRSEALAGTVANHPDNHKPWQLGEWFMKEDKNQRENMLVVEDICQGLQNCTHSLD